MILLKALLGLIVGAVVGAVLFVGLSYPLFLAAEGGRDMNGGIAMGMVTGIGPLGMLVGAVSGVILVLFLSRPTATAKPKRAPTGRRGFRVAGAIGLFAASYLALLSYLQGPPKISMETEPFLCVEFRTAVTSVVSSDEFKPRLELFGHSDNRIVSVPTTIRTDGDFAFLSGKIRVEKGKGFESLRMRAWFGPNLIVDSTVPLYPGAEVLPGLTKWYPVDHIMLPLSDELELGFSQTTHMYRFQVLPYEQQENG